MYTKLDNRLLRPAISFVSVEGHGHKGIGIERPDIQRFAIRAFAARAGYEIAEAFVEELAADQPDDLNQRPTLQQAIDAARQQGAPIIAASLSRLARETRLLGELMAHDVTYIICGMGVVTAPFFLERYQRMPQAERTDAQLAPSLLEPGESRAKVQRGNHAREVLAPLNRQKADRRAEELAHVIKPKLAAGKSLRRIAEELNEEGVQTARGGRWHLATVQRLVARLDP